MPLVTEIFHRAYRELSKSNQGFEEMERYFEIIRERVIDVRRDVNYVMRAVKELTVAAGVDKKIMTKITDEGIKSTFAESSAGKTKYTRNDCASEADHSVHYGKDLNPLTLKRFIYQLTMYRKDWWRIYSASASLR